ncbi:MAG: hypothetical protein LBI15_02950 [Dysgonamonadaceae bacterium]|nr:hypothetical protein [Dysgonamonadaceae bacterium]
MKKTKILFVCTSNQRRSVAAEQLYKNHPRLEVKSAGTGSHAKTVLSIELILWADCILCFTARNQYILEQRFPDIISDKIIDEIDVTDNCPYIIGTQVNEWLQKILLKNNVCQQ